MRSVVKEVNEYKSQNWGGKARTGTFWLIGGLGLGQLMRLGANVALASILFEEVFALMALVSVVLMGLAMFSDIGLKTNVVQHPRGDDPDFLNTAWTLQVIRGIYLFAAAVAVAWPVAEFYGASNPETYELRYLIPIVACTSILAGFQSAKVMAASRHLRIEELTRIEFISGVFNVTVMLLLAWYMKSAYALAISSVLSAALHTLLSYFMLEGPRSKFRWDPKSVRSLISFGKWVFLSTLITFLALQLDRLALAKFFDLAEVGIYSIAASLAAIVPSLVSSLQGAVLLPWYARKIEEGVPLPVVFTRTRNAMLCCSGFLCALLFAGSASFFELAYDERYAMGGMLLPVLAVGAWFGCLEPMYGATFLATGRPKWVAMTGACKVVVYAALLNLVVLFNLNIIMAAVFLSVSEALRCMVCHFLGRRLGLRNTRSELGMLALFLAISLLGWWLVEKFPAIADLGPFWRLVVLGLTTTFLFAPFFIRYVLPLVKQRNEHE